MADLELEDAPVTVDDPALAGEFDSLDSAPAGENNPAPAQSPSAAEPMADMPAPEPAPEPASAADKPADEPKPSETPPNPSPESNAPVSPSTAEFRAISQPPAFDPASVKPADLVKELSTTLGEIELLDESAEGGKVKFADLVKDSPSFMQAAAVMASAMVDKALAPYRQLMPVMQQQAIQSQREGFISVLEKEVEGARSLADDAAFWKWVDAQPKEIAAVADSTNPKAVARIMKMYREETGATAPAAQERAAKVEQATAAARKSAALHTGVETSRAAAAPQKDAAIDPAKLKEEFAAIGDD